MTSYSLREACSNNVDRSIEISKYPYHLNDKTNRKMNPSEISRALAIHYPETFERDGANSLGVDWGLNADDLRRRLDQMLHVIRNGRPESETPPLLDVGSEFGSLIDRTNELQILLT